jgi:AcrR family transcriptional regulator
MSKAKKRAYQSPVRQRQADETRSRIVGAARKLLEQKGYSDMTMEAIALEAEVAAPTVYANFRSKSGVVAEILDAARFGDDYQQAVREAMAEKRPRERLLYAPRIARRIYESESSVLDLLRGVGAVAPALARQGEELECRRYEMQQPLIEGLAEAQELRAGLDVRRARDILWSLTSRDLYRLLVRERGWTPQQYEDWLTTTLLETLVGKSKAATARRGSAASL